MDYKLKSLDVPLVDFESNKITNEKGEAVTAKFMFLMILKGLKVGTFEQSSQIQQLYKRLNEYTSLNELEYNSLYTLCDRTPLQLEVKCALLEILNSVEKTEEPLKKS